MNLLGVELKKAEFPNLVKWAERDPLALKSSVQRIMKKEGWTKPDAALTILETDLAHL